MAFTHAEPLDITSLVLEKGGLERLNAQAFAVGVPIYRGSTFPLDATDDQPLFQYERHVAVIERRLGLEPELVAMHRTYDHAGELVQSELAWLSERYGVHQLVFADHQRGVSGTAKVDAATAMLTFTLRDNGRMRHSTEPVTLPLVSGPSLFGYIGQHWESLLAGESQRVRFIMVKDMTTYGFIISLDRMQDGQVMFSMRPTNAFVRLALAPMRLTFDESSRQIVRFEGRVPPLDNRGDSLKALDARVEYLALQTYYQ